MTVSEFKPSYCPSTDCQSNGVVYNTKSKSVCSVERHWKS